jgi:uncharacterized sulfatase
VEPLYHLAFGKRPREELYDLQRDPDYMNNVAQDSAYAEARENLQQRLIAVLQQYDDPQAYRAAMPIRI